MTNTWTSCRVRTETKDRLEKMTSKDVGFDYALQEILNDYDRLVSEVSVKEPGLEIEPILEPIKEPEIIEEPEITDKEKQIHNLRLYLSQEEVCFEDLTEGEKNKRLLLFFNLSEKEQEERGFI